MSAPEPASAGPEEPHEHNCATHYFGHVKCDCRVAAAPSPAREPEGEAERLVEEALDYFEGRGPVLFTADGERTVTRREYLSRLLRDAQIAHAEDDAKAMCMCCAELSTLWLPPTRADIGYGRRMWSHAHRQKPGEPLGAKCQAGPIWERIKKLREG